MRKLGQFPSLLYPASSFKLELRIEWLLWRPWFWPEGFVHSRQKTKKTEVAPKAHLNFVTSITLKLVCCSRELGIAESQVNDRRVWAGIVLYLIPRLPNIFVRLNAYPLECVLCYRSFEICVKSLANFPVSLTQYFVYFVCDLQTICLAEAVAILQLTAEVMISFLEF